jgi:hypothetical protein
MLGRSVLMSLRMGIVPDEMVGVKAYAERLITRPASQKAFAFDR